MEEAEKITKQIEERSRAFAGLFTRMDRAYSMWKLVESDYDTVIDKKTKKHGSDIEIISNKPRTSCDSVQAILSSAERQITVRLAEEEGEDKRDDIGKLERLFSFLLEKADERLIRLLYPTLRE